MTMPFSDLERVYERLATAIDHAGPEKSEVFLAKVVLLLASGAGEAEGVLAIIDDALKEL